MAELNKERPELRIEDVNSVIAFEQPLLKATADQARIIVEGIFLLNNVKTGAHPAGPIATYQIRIELSKTFPEKEPKTYETGGQIPREQARHINSQDGSCCLTVWEHWLATAPDTSFLAFLEGPVQQFFLGQYLYEATGKWPLGEYSHGDQGLYEAYAEVLNIINENRRVEDYLRILARDCPKGHWKCPCGSGKRLRSCHKTDLADLRTKIPQSLAKRMLQRLIDSRRGRPI